MLLLKKFDLLNKVEFDKFNNMFENYLKETLEGEELQQELDDMHDEKLNREMIEQTLQIKNPYFIMQAIYNENSVGFISYYYFEEKHFGFINNLYVSPCYRNAGIGREVLRVVENNLLALGAQSVELTPIAKAVQFYTRNGYCPSRVTNDGERVFSKSLNKIDDM